MLNKLGSLLYALPVHVMSYCNDTWMVYKERFVSAFLRGESIRGTHQVTCEERTCSLQEMDPDINRKVDLLFKSHEVHDVADR